MILDTMTVGELKAFLNQFPDDKLVAFSYPSGDYWRTQLVSAIKEAELAAVKYSSYHRQFQIDEDGEEVLILG